MAPTWDALADMPDLHGKIALVTGGNGGVGRATVKFLALRGAKVYLAARSEPKAKAAIEKILAENDTIQKDQIKWLQLDLSDVRLVARAIEEMKTQEETLDLLVNNAGGVNRTLERTTSGWEMDMAVNYAGHFALTLGLLPLLERAAKVEGADVRVVSTISGVIAFVPGDHAMTFDPPTFLTDPSTDGTAAWRLLVKHCFLVDMPRYGISKLANMMFAKELQRRLDARGLPILSLAVDPGSVQSDDVFDIFRGYVHPLVRRVLVPIDQGALTTLFAATATVVRAEKDTYKGVSLGPVGRLFAPHALAKNDAQVKGLWDNTRAAVNKRLAEGGLAPIADV